jgi:Na+/proline symporter
MRDLNYTIEVLLFLGLSFFVTMFLAPKCIVNYIKWKKSGKNSHFTISFCFGVIALFFIIIVLMIGLEPFVDCPFPF